MWSSFGRLLLTAGAHELQLRYPGKGLAPGRGEQLDRLGPVALEPRTPGPRLTEVAPEQAQSLCGRSLDWLAVVTRQQ
jgi:hypothetical protein